MQGRNGLGMKTGRWRTPQRPHRCVPVEQAFLFRNPQLGKIFPRMDHSMSCPDRSKYNGFAVTHAPIHANVVGKQPGTSVNCTPAPMDPVFCNFKRLIRRVQKYPDPHLYLLILKSPTFQEVLIYSSNGILLTYSCGTGQFRAPCGRPRNIGCSHAPSLTNRN